MSFFKLLTVLLVCCGFMFPESLSNHDVHNTIKHLHIDGSLLSVYWIIPFIGILMSIAIFPLILPSYWHHNYGKVSAFWGILFLTFFAWKFGIDISIFYLLEVYLKEFIPFIVILLVLFTVSGCVLIAGNMKGTPLVNTSILAIGTILASWMGTTGASMLLIRPLIRSNELRGNKTHIFVFFIFLVSNIGGALTPLGDPPLFLCFLKGVNFFLTTVNLFIPMISISVPLLFIFYIFDSYLYKKENLPINKERIKIQITGKMNLLLILFIVVTVVISGIWKADSGHAENWLISYGGECMMTYGTFLQVILLLLITCISLKITPDSIRKKNDFTWEPIKEVSKLFATIFITMVPAIVMLKSGINGPLKSIISLLTDSDGNSMNIMYFWVTGILSSFLDNAPTYLVFFNIAGSYAPEGTIIAEYLMHKTPQTLMAISTGAVFMGAMTYIGNAPNFMIQSIAEENHVKMPSFFGYMLWSVLFLIPIFWIVTSVIF